MIVIATYPDATEAYAAKNLLESSGIHCQLRGDALAEMETINNIELLVAAKDATLAEEILANNQYPE